jgi:hypothetical protein
MQGGSNIFGEDDDENPFASVGNFGGGIPSGRRTQSFNVHGSPGGGQKARDAFGQQVMFFFFWFFGVFRVFWGFLSFLGFLGFLGFFGFFGFFGVIWVF